MPELAPEAQTAQPTRRDADERRAAGWLRGFDSASVARAAAIALIVLLAAYLRFSNLDWGGHIDEHITIKVVERMVRDHSLDTNWKLADVPPYFKYDQYNFSSYLYVSYIGYSVLRPVLGPFLKSRIGALDEFHMAELIYRSISALFGVSVCFLALAIARRLTGPTFALIAPLVIAVFPLLVQDGHYGRPEAFLTALFSLAVYILLRSNSGPVGGRRQLQGFALAGLAIGFSVACKVSMAACLFLLAPWPALGIVPPGAPKGSFRGRAAVKCTVTAILGGAIGFISGVPFALIHPRAWWTGVQFLRGQYAASLGPWSPYPEDFCFRFINTYAVQTLGPLLLVVAGMGVYAFVRKREVYGSIVLVAPLCVFYLIFGLQKGFTERNLSHVAPMLAVLCAVGGAEIYAISRNLVRSHASLVTLGILAAALYFPLTLSWKFVFLTLSPRKTNYCAIYEAVLGRVYPGIPVYTHVIFNASEIAEIHAHAATSPNGYLVKIFDYNDEATRYNIQVAQRLLGMRLITVIPSDFPDLAANTLVFHSPNAGYYFIAPPARAAPVPPNSQK